VFSVLSALEESLKQVCVFRSLLYFIMGIQQQIDAILAGMPANTKDVPKTKVSEGLSCLEQHHVQKDKTKRLNRAQQTNNKDSLLGRTLARTRRLTTSTTDYHLFVPNSPTHLIVIP
jgi:hypothetical protein